MLAPVGGGVLVPMVLVPRGGGGLVPMGPIARWWVSAFGSYS